MAPPLSEQTIAYGSFDVKQPDDENHDLQVKFPKEITIYEKKFQDFFED